MEKDFATLVLGGVSLFFILLFGAQNAVVSVASAIIAIAFGVMAIRSKKGKKLYIILGMALGLVTLGILVITHL